MASDLQLTSLISDSSTPIYNAGLGSQLKDALAEQPATHAYYLNGEAKPMVVNPSKLAVKLADGVTQIDLENLGLEFERTLTDDYSVYKSANESSIDRARLNSSGLVDDSVSVFFVQGSRSDAVVLDEVIVSLKPGVTESDYFTGNTIFSSHRPIAGTPNQFVARVADGMGEVALHVANSIDEDSRLEFTSPNFYQSWEKYFTPNDTRFANLWHLNNTGQSGGLVDADPDLPEAWDTTKGSSTVVIGVLDDGISTHADLTLWKNPGEIPDAIDNDGNGWLDENNGWNFVTNDEVTNNSTINDRHGTAIAGVATARGENALGVVGVAYQSRALVAKMAQNGVATNDANIASAFYYAAGRTANGLGTWKASDVIVWAWGGGSGAAVINTAMTWATTNGNLGKGTAIFVGTGNNNGAVTEPALQSLTNPGVIAVGAYNNKGVRSDYSNFGAALDIMAPSNDGRAGYLGIDTTDRTGADGYDAVNDYTGTANLTGWGAGTSTAAAVAAGIGALTITRSIALGMTPALTATQLKSYLRANTDYIGGQFATYDTGTGRATEYGYGAINANSAVTNLNKPEISVMTDLVEVQSGNTVVVGSAQFGATVDRVIRIRNQGTQTLNLTSLSLPSGPFTIVSPPGSTALALGEATTFTVRYSPTGGGVQTQVLTINNNDTSEGAFTITLSGTGPNVTGKVFEDWDGDSVLDTPDILKTGHTVYVDANNNGIRDTASTNFANNTVTPIPDVTTITSTISVSGLASVVRDLNVRVNLTHTFDGDLMMTLISPSGTRVMLANRIGGAGDNFTNTVFDDEAATLISAGTAPFTGSFRPLQPLSAFDSLNGNGTWTLEIAEQYAGDAGSLTSWDLTIATAEDTVVTAADGTYGLFNVPIGANVIRQEPPAGWSVANGISYTANIATSNDNLQDRNFGIGKNDRFYAAVFDDYNVNGIWDIGEVAVSGRVIVDDLNNNGINDGGGETNASIAANGYGFMDLPAGAHNMLLDTFTGWRYTIPANGVRNVTASGTPLFDQRFGTRLNNRAPTDIALSANTIAENSASGTNIGLFTSTDPDFANTFTYTLVTGTGDTDNALFTIDGSGNLLSAASYNFEATPTLSVRVRTTDQDGLFFEEAFSITVIDVNEAPTDISLSGTSSILENAGAGTTIGGFSSADVDAGASHTYTLVSGTGSTDNSQFTIDGSGNLHSAVVFNFETTPSLSIRVRTTDQGGLFFEKVFTITVTDVNEAPSDIALSANTIVENSSSGTSIGSFSSTDQDAANTFTYTLVPGTGSTDNGLFTIDGSGTLKSAAAFDFETTPSFSIRVRTTDQGGLFFEKVFSISVTDINEAPSDLALTPSTIVENSSIGSTVGAFSSTDQDAANTFTYTLVGGTGSTDNALFTIDGSGNLKTAAPIDFESTPSFSIRVRTTDQGGLFFEKPITVSVSNANETPTDIGISASSIAENSVSGSTIGIFNSTDPDAANTFTYTLVPGTGSTDNAQFTIDGSGNLKTAAVFDFESNATYSIRVRTTDQGGLFFEKVFSISVTDVNEAPSDIALSANTIAENAATGVTIGSFSSTDQDAANTFTYSLVSGTGSTDNAQFTIDGSGNLKSAASLDFEASPTRSIRVRTTDQGGLFFEKIFTINVTNVNETPTDIAISADTVAENAASGTSVGSFSSTDPDAANTFTYTLVSGTGSTDNALFTIDGSGTLKTAATFNFEATPTLSVRVRTTDQGGLFFEKIFTINVTNINETPTDIAISASSVAENLGTGATVGSFSTTDPDAANTFTYTLVAGTGSTDNGQFTIDGSGNLKTAAAFDFEATPSFSVRVRTTDQGGLFFEKIFTINVTNVNETPTDVALSANTIAENASIGTTVGSFSSTDPDAANTFAYTLVSGTGSTDNAQFTIDGSGNLKTAASFNFEASPTLSIRVRTTDQGGLFFEKVFTINVTDINETPTDIAISASTIAENASIGTTVGSFTTTDADAGNTFAYTLVGGTGSTDNALFTIDGSGTLKTAATFNFETTPSLSIRVRTTDQGGLFFEKVFTITVTNINETPTDVAISANSIVENSAIGSTVGSFSTTDPDAANTFTYTLVAGTGSTDNGQFTIDGSGNLKTAAVFNFEAASSYSIRVRSTDQGGLFVEKVFTISVTDANEAPTDIALSANTVQENLASGTTVGSFSSTDPDPANTFTYTLVAGTGSTDNALFTIDGSGNLKTAAALNFETNPTLSIRVRSTDQGGQFFEKVFTITVTNILEMVGSVTIGTGGAQRSLVKQLVLTFDGLITIDSGAFALIKRGVGGGAVTTSIATATNAGQTTVTLTFSGAFTRGSSGILVDGYYQLTVDGSKIHSGAETVDFNGDGVGGDTYVLGAAEADNFFALFGDTSGDGLVGIAEFGQFRTSFGKLLGDPAYNAQFDFEGDGAVGVADFGQFRSRFGQPKLAFS